MTDTTHDDAVTLRRILAEQGLDDGGFSPHSWRCEHADRYPDYCTCVADCIDAILAAGFKRGTPPREQGEHDHEFEDRCYCGLLAHEYFSEGSPS